MHPILLCTYKYTFYILIWVLTCKFRSEPVPCDKSLETPDPFVTWACVRWSRHRTNSGYIPFSYIPCILAHNIPHRPAWQIFSHIWYFIFHSLQDMQGACSKFPLGMICGSWNMVAHSCNIQLYCLLTHQIIYVFFHFSFIIVSSLCSLITRGNLLHIPCSLPHTRVSRHMQICW